MINPSIISTEASAEIARLTTKNYELDSKIEVGQQQSQKLTYQMISKIGAVNNQLEMLKVQLTSSNETLEKEIVQLKFQYDKEIHNLADGVKLKITLIAARVQALVEKLNSYVIGDFAKENIISETALELLKTLVADIAKCQDMAIPYPKYDDLQENLIAYQKQIIIFPVTTELSLAKTDSILKAFIEEAEFTYGALKKEVEPLEQACQSLISKKEMIIDFHAKSFKEFQKEEILTLKKVYDLIHSADKQIEWSTLFLLKPNSYAHHAYRPAIRAAHIKAHQEKLNIKANKMKEKMGLIVTNLGSIVNPEVSKEGTKS